MILCLVGALALPACAARRASNGPRPALQGGHPLAGEGRGASGVVLDDAQAFARRYLQLLDRDDAIAAYALLGRDVQARIGLAAFQTQWTESREERQLQAAALRAQLQARAAVPVTVRALITLDSGVRIELSDRGDGLRLNDPELRSARPRTPTEALRLLLRAAEQRDLPALLRVLSPAQRQRMEDELNERIALLRRALYHSPTAAQETRLPAGAKIERKVKSGPGLPSQTSQTNQANQIDQRGDRARFRYDPRFFIDLRRDQDSWWVEELN